MQLKANHDSGYINRMSGALWFAFRNFRMLHFTPDWAHCHFACCEYKHQWIKPFTAL